MKNILLGISGSIAAYKAPELCRLLQKAGFSVKVVLTSAGKEFVSPLTLKTLTEDQVYIVDSLNDLSQEALLHIHLARWADVVLIAPTTANIMAKLAHGIADDLLTSVCLASVQPIILAPSMNIHMWENQATQENRETLLRRGVTFLGPDIGEQACGDVGSGRLIELPKIVEYLVGLNRTEKVWVGRTIMITAGPTMEAIDPVRFISNRSSGKMGYALASAAQQMGARVILISGPTQLMAPTGVERICVTTAQQMLEAAKTYLTGVDIFIGAAAVADWHVSQPESQKIKHKMGTMTLDLVPNIDIIGQVSQFQPKPFMVGFAAETQNMEGYAREKLVSKNLDLVIANDVSQQDIGFSSDDNAVTLVSHHQTKKIEKMPKTQLAWNILHEIDSLYQRR